MARRGRPDAGDEDLTRALLGADADADADADPVGDGAPEKTPGRWGFLRGWSRVFRGNRALWLTAAVAAVSLVAGLLVGSFVISPADAASRAQAPAPGLITVPVEFGALSNDVTIRADVGYADATSVTLDTSGLSGPAVVTGQVPEVGAQFSALSIALEVAGRPVIVLPGELPAYRTLRFGVSGPDVTQLKEALRAVGIDGGDPASNVFDRTTADGVSQLYAAAGYPAPAADGGAAGAVRAAEESLRAARQSAATAQADLDRARGGPSAVDVRRADNEVAAAQRAVNDARAAGASATEIANLDDALALAVLQRDALSGSVDTTGPRAARDAANAQVEQAERDLERARQDTLTFLPASEVLYLTSLPRRVDAVTAVRGSILQGAAMTVSGATVRLNGSAAEADARLLKVGGEATFPLADGATHRAVIASVGPSKKKDAAGRWEIVLEPDALSAEQIAQLQGSNVRVSIPVGATDGDVLSVPVSALTAGPGGESRVEVVDSDPREGAAAKTRLVVVKTGLAANGAVEVEAVEGTLDKGDLVVVGR